MKKTFLGFSWVGWLNMLFLQFLGIRLYYWMGDTTEGYGVLGFVLPLSGWFNCYVPNPIFKKTIFTRTVKSNV